MARDCCFVKRKQRQIENFEKNEVLRKYVNQIFKSFVANFLVNFTKNNSFLCEKEIFVSKDYFLFAIVVVNLCDF